MIYALTNAALEEIIFHMDGLFVCIERNAGGFAQFTKDEARAIYVDALADGLRRNRTLEARLIKERDLQDAECEAGRCNHYTCTEGASIDGWKELEPTGWDYASEAYGATGRDDADRAIQYPPVIGR
tara:strand:- start:1452 stop:1832 length:381 start_codon:yes stop_codon:yes gene_type:complete